TLVTAAEVDYQVARQLDSIRLEASQFEHDKVNAALAGPKYEKLFLHALKLDLRSGPLPELVKQVKESPLRYVLVAALDHWAGVSADKELVSRLLEAARLADPDPWREQVRNVNTWQDLGKLQQLAGDVKPQRQSPQILMLLVQRLMIKEARHAATALLRRALV